MMSLSPVAKEDFGLYQCRASNSIGEAVKDIAVTGKYRQQLYFEPQEKLL